MIRRDFPLVTALRGIAVVAVMTFHVASLTDAVNASVTGRFIAQLGNIAPIIFFVVSGFLLSRPYLVASIHDEPAPDLRRYVRRRCLRILPPYWTALTLLAIFPGIVGAFSGDWWRYYGLLQVYSARTIGQGIPPAWTLCVEVSFYAALPLWGWLTRRSSARTHAVVFAALCGVGVAVQLLAAHQTVNQLVADALPGQIAWFGLGGTLALWTVTGPDLRVPALGAWAVAAGAMVLLIITVEGRTLARSWSRCRSSGLCGPRCARSC